MSHKKSIILFKSFPISILFINSFYVQHVKIYNNTTSIVNLFLLETYFCSKIMKNLNKKYLEGKNQIL